MNFFFLLSRFLAATERLYADEGQRLISEQEVSVYLAHVDKRLTEENERLNYYLDSCTKPSLIHCVEKQLLSEHLQTILQKGVDTLLDENRLPELTLLYNLLARIKNGLPELCINVNAYIKVGSCFTSIILNFGLFFF